MTTLSICPRLTAIWPDLFVTGLVVEDADRMDPGGADAALSRGIQSARERLAAREPLSQEPALAQWREAYGRAGVKPSKFRSSIESLAKRALGDGIRPISPLVDVYNGCSLQALAPMGAIDLDRLEGDTVELRLCRPATDRFLPLGGEPEAFPLSDTLPVYAAGDEILCWGFNVRDSRATAIDDASRRVLFLTEGVSALHQTHAGLVVNLLQAALAAGGVRAVGRVQAGRSPDLSLTV